MSLLENLETGTGLARSNAMINEVITATERILVNKTGRKCVPKRSFSFMLRLDVHPNNLIETKIIEREFEL